jgi:DNA-binding CsgD family transcriptional regulator
LKVMHRSEQSRQLVKPHELVKPGPSFPQDIYFFYEKTTGVSHFHVNAGPDGRFPVEQAAGLLAMHCMVRGQTPADYVVMVRAEESLLEGLKEKAEHLLAAGKSVHSQIKLTRREEEVLAGVMRSLANKEIASMLNLSERTVKFHVSSLLAKFRVRGRMELVREAARQTSSSLPIPAAPVTREAHGFAPAASTFAGAARAASVVPLAKRTMMA